MHGEHGSFGLTCHGLTCRRAGVSVRDINAQFRTRHLSVLRGAADSGKELMLRCLGLLEKPECGDVVIALQPCSHLGEPDLADMRRRHFAYLFAAPFLLPAFTVVENVVMPMFKVLDSGPAEARRRAEELLAFVGLTEHEQDRAGSLSAFKQRCTALARALAIDPAVVLVEDLEAGLTSEQQKQFTQLLRAASERWNLIVVATALPSWSGSPGDCVYDLTEGQLQPASEPQPLS